jgi:hypothetical protein
MLEVTVFVQGGAASGGDSPEAASPGPFDSAPALAAPLPEMGPETAPDDPWPPRAAEPVEPPLLIRPLPEEGLPLLEPLELTTGPPSGPAGVFDPHPNPSPASAPIATPAVARTHKTVGPWNMTFRAPSYAKDLVTRAA